MHVLVVDGDATAAELLTSGLRRHGHSAESVETGTAALEAYTRADLMLLSLELPDLNGLELCRTVRAAVDTPIVGVTASDNDLDRVLALRAGTDDCLKKSACLERSYGLRELMARIEAVMRLARRSRNAARAVSLGALHINPGKREVRVHGRLVDLTRKEFDLLHLLARHSERIVSRRQIMSEVWDDHNQATISRTLDMHVSGLRSKLGSNSWIITARGVGFQLGEG